MTAWYAGSHLHRVTYTRWCVDTIRFSWLWALGCSKHVEKWNKQIHRKKCVKFVIDKNHADIKNERSCTSIIPHVFMTCARVCTLSTRNLVPSIKWPYVTLWKFEQTPPWCYVRNRESTKLWCTRVAFMFVPSFNTILPMVWMLLRGTRHRCTDKMTT